MSPRSIEQVQRGVRFFNTFMGGVDDVAKVQADDLRRFVVALQRKPKWADRPHCKGDHLSSTSVNTYVRAVKSFWGWLKREGMISDNPLADVAAPKRREPVLFSRG